MQCEFGGLGVVPNHPSIEQRLEMQPSMCTLLHGYRAFRLSVNFEGLDAVLVFYLDLSESTLAYHVQITA